VKKRAEMKGLAICRYYLLEIAENELGSIILLD